MILNTDKMTPAQYELYLRAKQTNDLAVLLLLEDVESLRNERDDALTWETRFDEVQQDLDSATLEVERLEAEVDKLEDRIQELEGEDNG